MGDCRQMKELKNCLANVVVGKLDPLFCRHPKKKQDLHMTYFILILVKFIVLLARKGKLFLN